MKRIIFTLLIAISSAMTFTSCTEEEVAPNTENGGAVFKEPVVK
ncbi:MAG: hypothetical protein ABIR06_15920 [Cyclobacteriaceae bacterium]